MAEIVWGIVKGGVIVPGSALPEGTHVEIRVCKEPPDVPPDLQAEFAAWEVASSEALANFERHIQDMDDTYEKR